jgi:hypothetical protein
LRAVCNLGMRVNVDALTTTGTLSDLWTPQEFAQMMIHEVEAFDPTQTEIVGIEPLTNPDVITGPGTYFVGVRTNGFGSDGLAKYSDCWIPVCPAHESFTGVQFGEP